MWLLSLIPSAHVISSCWIWTLLNLVNYHPLSAKEERVLGEERATELSRLTSMFVLRRTQEIINCYLPPRHDWTLFCGATALQTELYQQLLGHRVFRACLQGSGQTHTHLACITALKKLCNHPGLLHATVKVRAGSQSPNPPIRQ